MKCPINKDNCPCSEYSKEGLCDWPFETRGRSPDSQDAQIWFTDSIFAVNGKTYSIDISGIKHRILNIGEALAQR